jgi:hypothetical protein
MKRILLLSILLPAIVLLCKLFRAGAVVVTRLGKLGRHVRPKRSAKLASGGSPEILIRDFHFGC